MFHKKKLYKQIKFLLLALLPIGAIANQDCDGISYVPVRSPDTTIPSYCRCDKSLNNSQATLFSDLEIGAACGLVRMVIQGTDLKFEKIDIENEKISFDRFKDGLMGIVGEIYLKGKITLSGIFKHYPTDGYGDKWFDPDGEPIAPDDTPLGAQARSYFHEW